MSAISSWVMSICGVSILSVLIDLFLPEGQTNKHIKNIFSFAILLVMIAPLPNLIKSASGISDIFKDFDYTIQTDYIYGVNESKIEKLCEDIQKELVENGILNVDVEISVNTYDINLDIDGIYIDLEHAVLSNEINKEKIHELVFECVAKKIDINKEQVVIYE